MLRKLEDADGTTLAEVLLAGAVLTLIFTAVVSLLLIGYGTSKSISVTTEENQQLRIAMKQISDDLAFAWWPKPGDPKVGANGFTVRAYQLTGVTPKDAWPNTVPYPTKFLLLDYSIEGENLIRSVRDAQYLDRIYSSTVVATGILPPDDPDGHGSYLLADDASKTLKVMLRAANAGGNGFGETYREFYLRY